MEEPAPAIAVFWQVDRKIKSTEPMARYVVISTLALLLIVAGVAFASATEVRQISIHSGWGGLGTPHHTDLLIQNDHGLYRLNGAQVDALAVNMFLTSVREPVIPQPTLPNLGISKPWLENNANAIVRDAKAKDSEDSTYWKIGGGTPKQKRLFETFYADPAFVAKVLPEIFRCCHTDDNPGVSVTITYVDGSTSVVSSHSQSEFMLPWKLEQNGTAVETFNSNISTALAKLMPDGATNRERIVGDGLALHLV
jgi:hypothetical protein